MIDLLSMCATIALGLFAGSLLTEAMILVPYWRRMPPADFFQLHSSLGPQLFKYFAPLTSLATVLVVAVATIHGTANIAWLVAATMCVLTLVIFFSYFRTANNRFATHDMPNDALQGELTAWSKWHWLRTMLVIIALGASVLGHTQ